jgi:hypothetical protein
LNCITPRDVLIHRVNMLARYNDGAPGEDLVRALEDFLTERDAALVARLTKAVEEAACLHP